MESEKFLMIQIVYVLRKHPGLATLSPEECGLDNGNGDVDLDGLIGLVYHWISLFPPRHHRHERIFPRSQRKKVWICYPRSSHAHR
jgi:hypothetical protein